MAKCSDQNRPKADAPQAEQTTVKFTLDDIKDMPVSVTVFAGCVEGDRVTYSLRGDSRAVLLYGSVVDVLNYSRGQEVTLTSAGVPEPYRGKPFRRNVDRKQEDAVKRIGTEMNAKYTIQVNGTVVTPDSIVNSYFDQFAMVQEKDEKGNPKGKPYQRKVSEITPTERVVKQGAQELRFMGGVEIIASAVITPGYDAKTQ